MSGRVVWVDGVSLAPSGGPTFALAQADAKAGKPTWSRGEAGLDEVLEIALVAVPPSGDRTVQTDARSFRGLRVASAERLYSPRAFLRKALPGLRASDSHEVYCLRNGTQTYFFPALLLAKLLFGHTRWLFSRLFTAESLDTIIRPGTKPVGGLVNIHISARESAPALGDDTLRTLAWLCASDDARRAWSSVYMNAWSRGRLDFDIPDVLMDGWPWGIVVGDGLFVCELRGLRLTFPQPIREIRVSHRNRSRSIPGRGVSDSATSFGSRTEERRSPAFANM